MKLIEKDAVLAIIEKFMYGANIEADIASTGECFDEKVADAKYQLCKCIKGKIDTLEVKEVDLQEEPVSEELEETAWLYYDKNRLPIPPEWNLNKEFIDFFKAGAQWQKSKEESSTEDLEEESKKYSSCIYLEEVLSDDDKEVLKARLINTFKAGAKWQLNKIRKKYEKNRD